MRLIDADELLRPKKVQTYYKLVNGDTALSIHVVKNAPTVKAVPLHEGHWIDRPAKGKGGKEYLQSWCSYCNQRNGIPGIDSHRHKPYCPNCGARMRLDITETYGLTYEE